MAEAFKERFNEERVRLMGRQLAKVEGAFPEGEFCKRALEGLEELELKARSKHIQRVFGEVTPGDFAERCELIVRALHPEEFADGFAPELAEGGLTSWSLMPLADYVGENGAGELGMSLEVLREVTKRFTAEFAIRPLMMSAQYKVIKVLRGWVEDPNHHVRRLVSEGTRSRLPWGLQLRSLVADPKPMLPLLTALRDDPSDYVRRSVANHLNDISKDHPELVVSLASEWMKGASVQREKLLRHACRTLLKKGDPGVLRVFGYDPPSFSHVAFGVHSPVVQVGEKLRWLLEVTVSSNQSLMIDHAIGYRKKNGETSWKVFKGTKWTLRAGETKTWQGSHSFRPVTVRTLYPGPHGLRLLVNGEVVGERMFEVVE